MKARAECTAVVVLDTYTPALGATVDFGGFTARAGAVAYHSLLTIPAGLIQMVPCSENYVAVAHIQNLDEATDLYVSVKDITGEIRTLAIAPEGCAVICGITTYNGVCIILEGSEGQLARVFLTSSDTWQVDATTTKGEETD